MWLVTQEGEMSSRRIKDIKNCNVEFSFEKVPNKPWLSIYSGKGPNYILNEDHDYGENMAEKLFQAFKIWYDKICIDIKKI